MTVLDFDPPQPALRLVSSNGEISGRDTRYRHGSPLFGSARELYRGVLSHSLANGLDVNPDALRIVLATKQATTAVPAHVFTAADIWQLLFVDVLTWCRNRQLDVPSGCAHALGILIDYIADTGLLDDDCDTRVELRDAIDECTGGWALDHPTSLDTTT